MRFRNGAQVAQKRAGAHSRDASKAPRAGCTSPEELFGNSEKFQSVPGALHRHSKNGLEAFSNARQGGVSTDLGCNGAVVALPFTLKALPLTLK